MIEFADIAKARGEQFSAFAPDVQEDLRRQTEWKIRAIESILLLSIRDRETAVALILASFDQAEREGILGAGDLVRKIGDSIENSAQKKIFYIAADAIKNWDRLNQTTKEQKDADVSRSNHSSRS